MNDDDDDGAQKKRKKYDTNGISFVTLFFSAA